MWDFLADVDAQIHAQEARPVTGSLCEDGLTEAWFAQLSERCQNVVQLTPPCPMVAESVDEALDMVFDALIVDGEPISFDVP